MFLVTIFFIGYVRETVFLVINSVVNKYPFPYNPSYITPPSFLYTCSNQTLINVKWSLTFGFSLIFFLVSYLLVRFYFNNKYFNKVTIWIYALLVGVSFIIVGLGIVLGSFNETYAISRFIIGLAQSPLVPLVLFVLFYFKTKVDTTTT